MPARTNDRIRMQHGTFTVHGSAILVDQKITRDSVNQIGTIESISEHVDKKNAYKIFTEVSIPKSAKPKIRKELELLGINISTMFPEIDYQMKQFRKNWEDG